MDAIKSLILHNPISVVSVIGIIVGVILFYVYKKQIMKLIYPNRASSSSSTEEGDGNNNNEAEENKSATLMMFSVDWCPHCKDAKPEWEAVKAEYSDRTINGYNVAFDLVNCTTETLEVKEIISTYKIEGYPTVKLVKGNQIYDFDAKPTKSNLIEFLKASL
jgi:thiol-disulfide isomerase/thioredoxin